MKGDNYSIMPDSELRTRYDQARRIRWLLCSPLILALFLLVTSLIGIVSCIMSLGKSAEVITDVAYLFSMIAAFIGISDVLTDNSRKHFRISASCVVIQALLFAAVLVTSEASGALLQRRVQDIQLLAELGMTALTAAVNIAAHPFIKELEILKAHPRFPFNNWQKDEAYLLRVPRDKASRLIGNTADRDKVRNVGGEEFFEGKAKAYEELKSDPEKNLQQRKQVWRQHDKSDTAYSMDNLKNMYFDAPDEGELSGKELERELMKATAPKKAPEPPPEDFFQSSPVIWRTNRDGTTTIEHRAPGSKPAGDFDSRSVLP